MIVGYDPVKNTRNIKERGLSFDLANEIDWDNASVKIDDRHDYGEIRYQALFYLDGKPYVIVYTLRNEGTTMWVISLRRAHLKEAKSYGKET